jgi:hypothetical protein
MKMKDCTASVIHKRKYPEIIYSAWESKYRYMYDGLFTVTGVKMNGGNK